MGFVVAGAQYTGDVLVKNPADQLVDPDAGTLSLVIRDPDGVILDTIPEAELTRLSVGHFEYVWTTTEATDTGTWRWEWDADLEGADLPNSIEDVIVLPVGSLSSGELTDDELLAFGVGTDLDVVARALLLSATAGLIAGLFDVTERTDIRDGGSSIIFLSRAAGEIAAIVETVGDTETELDEDDWLLRSDGRAIERLGNGTNPPSSWWPSIAWAGRIAITWTPEDDTPAESVRKMVQLALVKLEITRSPGLVSERIGEWAETYAAAGDSDTERAAILAGLYGPVETWSFA